MSSIVHVVSNGAQATPTERRKAVVFCAVAMVAMAAVAAVACFAMHSMPVGVFGAVAVVAGGVVGGVVYEMFKKKQQGGSPTVH